MEYFCQMRIVEFGKIKLRGLSQLLSETHKSSFGSSKRKVSL